MAYKIKTSIKTTKATKPVYVPDSKMNNYDIIYDEDKMQYRSGFYSNEILSQEILASDTIWTIETGFEGRTDLISQKFFDTPIYDWAIEDINNIEDPIRDIVAGEKIYIPSISKLS